MATIRSSGTEANLKHAFAAEILASRRCLAFAVQAKLGGDDQLSAVFRMIAQRRHGSSYRHLEALEDAGGGRMDRPDPGRDHNARTTILAELRGSGGQYPAMARAARHQGLDEVASWFEILAKAGRSAAGSDARVKRSCDQALFDWG